MRVIARTLIALIALFFLFLSLSKCYEMGYKRASALGEQTLVSPSGTSVQASRSGDSFVYQGGQVRPLDGLGFLILASSDVQQACPAGRDVQPFPASDYPIVVFYNAGGFDSSGLPVAVRALEDGRLLWERWDRPEAVVLVEFSLSGSHCLVTYRDGTTERVSAADWERHFLLQFTAGAP